MLRNAARSVVIVLMTAVLARMVKARTMKTLLMKPRRKNLRQMIVRRMGRPKASLTSKISKSRT